MSIFLDLSYFSDFLNSPFTFLEFLSFILIKTWWIILLWMIGYLFFFFWTKRVQTKFSASVKYTILEASVPPTTIERGPKNMEQFFASLRGIMSEPNWKDKLLEGKSQLSLSFELIADGNTIRFLIRTPSIFRDVIEAAIYAQYPEALIQETEDYAISVPDKFPNEEWDLWGAELKLSNKSDVYPIRTYPFFVDEYSKDEKFIDPMAAIIEFLGRLFIGEQIWFQFIITPVGDSWQKRGIKQVKKLVGEKVKEEETMAKKIIFAPLRAIDKHIIDTILSLGSEKKSEKEDLVNKMQYLSPGEKEILAGIEGKISKIGYLTKARFIYIGKKEVFNKVKGVTGGMGVINQFTDQNLNGLKPDSGTMTTAPMFFPKKRLAKKQTKLLKAYKARERFTGGKEFILNIEELATIYHFPTISVKAPLLTKLQARTSEPPTFLPTGDIDDLSSLSMLLKPRDES